MLISGIATIIHSAVAPVVVLAGVGTMLRMLARRLGRIVDRTRVVEDMRRMESGGRPGVELAVLHRRCCLVGRAVALATVCGLLICLVITMLFVGRSAGFDLGAEIAAAFIAAMLCLSGAFVCFLLEILAATRHMRASRRP